MAHPVLKVIITFSLILSVQTGFAQISRFLEKEYTHWTVEANVGIPFPVGTLSAFSADKTYIGNQYGVRAGFQMNRIFGFGFTLSSGQSKLGARDYAAEYLLGADGRTYYFPQEIPTYPYKDIYSDISFISGGVYTEINLINLVGWNSCDYGFSVLLIPSAFVQQTEAKVRRKNDNIQLIPSRSGMSIGLGGDIGIRFRTCKWIDLQLRTGITWLSNNDFVGFSTPVQARYNYMWTTSLGVIFKIPERGKRDNIIYMPQEGDCHWPTK